MNSDRVNAEYPHSELTGKVLRAAFTVSNSLGYGFLEKVYENAIVVELTKIGLRARTQHPIGIRYKGVQVGDYVADLIVEESVLVEIKATIEHHDVFVAQTINYLKATGLPVGLLLNFGKPRLRYRRFIAGKFDLELTEDAEQEESF